MAKRTPPWPAYPEWSTAKFWSFLRSGLRNKWLRWPPRYNVLYKSRKPVSGKRHKHEYQCSSCKGWFMQKNVEVDHIVPVGSLNSYKDLAGFTKRLFVEEAGLRVVCKPCHKSITNSARNEE